MPNYLLDTHFSQRGREARLIRLIQDTRIMSIGTTRGFGVDEDTALVVTGLPNRPVATVIKFLYTLECRFLSTFFFV